MRYGDKVRRWIIPCALALLALLLIPGAAALAEEQPEATATPVPLVVGPWQVEPFRPVQQVEETPVPEETPAPEAAEAEDAPEETPVPQTQTPAPETETAAPEATGQPEALLVVKYLGEDAQVEVPEALTLALAEGEEPVTLPVIALGENAFRENVQLTGVTLPDSVLTIGEGAFYGCTALTQVRLPQKLEKLETDLFYGCTALAEIELPASLTNIGYGCFEGCTALNHVVLPEEVDTVRGNAFKDCTALSEIKLSRRLAYLGGHVFQNTPWLKAQTEEFVIVGDNVLLRYNGKAREVQVPENVRLIVDAFENNKRVKVVRLPEKLSRIGCNAFAGCTGIEGMELPVTLREVGEYAFAGCVNLKQLELPEAVNYIGAQAFRDCRALKQLNLPKSVSEIGSRAFWGCKRLTQLEVPEGILEVGSETFAGCTRLTEVSLPLTLTRVAENAFSGAKKVSLKLVYDSVAERFAIAHKIPYSYKIQYNDEFAYLRGPEGIALIDYLGVAAEVDVPETIDGVPVSSVGAGAFQEAGELTEVTLPGSVTKVGDWAFSYLEQLERVVLPSQVTALGADAFRGCAGLLEVYLPESLGELGEDAFADCPQVTVLADTGSFASAEAQRLGLNTIDPLLAGSEFTYEKREGTLALTGYTGSQAVLELPLSRTRRAVSVVAGGAFEANSVITQVTVPEGYTAIERGAFAGIAQPLTLVLPDGLQILEEGAFEGSNSITLKGRVGTLAEAYARQYGLKFLVIHE